MTRETIEKLHELEAKRNVWIAFKDALVKHRNVCIQDYSHTPCIDVMMINSLKLDNWQCFQDHVMKYVDMMINLYSKEISEL